MNFIKILLILFKYLKNLLITYFTFIKLIYYLKFKYCIFYNSYFYFCPLDGLMIKQVFFFYFNKKNNE